MNLLRRAYRWGVLLLILGLVLPPVATADETLPALVFAEPDALSFTISANGDAAAETRTVFVRNQSAVPVTVAFGLAWEDAVSPAAGQFTVEPGGGALLAGDVGAFDIALSPAALGAGKGFLVARAVDAPGVQAAVLPLAVSAAPTPAFAGTVVQSLLLAALVVLAGAVWLQVAGLNPLTTWIYGQAGWSLKDSWMSNLALVAGLAQPLLDAETPGLSEEGYLVVVAVFGLLVLAAPLLYNAFLVPVVAEGDAEPPAPVRGPVWAYLITTFITLWGVLGEFLSGYRLLRGASLGAVLAPAESDFFLRVLPLIIGLLLVAYTLLTLYRQVVSQHVPREGRDSVRVMMAGEVASADLPEPAPRWALL